MQKFYKVLLVILFFVLSSLPALAEDTKVTDNPAKINLVWQPAFIKTSDDFAKLAHIEGITVVSPCWFDIVNVNGLVRNKADVAYAQTVHKKGYKLWALITNSFNPEITHSILQDKTARSYVIEQMLINAKKYNLDGYNIDFENIRDSDKDLLTQFLKEIYTAMKTQNLVVSMDITVPSKEPYWSKCYDRKALGKTLDYIMLMAYDEHHPSSPTMGSTASINWVRNGLKNTLKEIPSNKLLLGLPLYMRIWQQNNETGKFTGKTLTMPQAEKIIVEKDIHPKWLAKQGQYYFSYTDGKMTYKVWQENKFSLELKTKLVNKYNLAGIACWRKGFETPDIWPALFATLKEKTVKYSAND